MTTTTERPTTYVHSCGLHALCDPPLPRDDEDRWCGTCGYADTAWTRLPGPAHVYADAADLLSALDDEIGDRGELLGLDTEAIAKAAGVYFSTVRHVRHGYHDLVTLRDVVALLRWLASTTPTKPTED